MNQVFSVVSWMVLIAITKYRKWGGEREVSQGPLRETQLGQKREAAGSSLRDPARTEETLASRRVLFERPSSDRIINANIIQ